MTEISFQWAMEEPLKLSMQVALLVQICKYVLIFSSYIAKGL